MKKLITMPLVLVFAVLLTACNVDRSEQAKHEVIQKAASADLDKVIEENAVMEEAVLEEAPEEDPVDMDIEEEALPVD